MFLNKSKKYLLLKFISSNEPALIQTIADEFYESNYYSAQSDLKILQLESLVRPHKGTENNIEFFELTIKGKEYIEAYKDKKISIYIPLIISSISLGISLITFFLKLLEYF